MNENINFFNMMNDLENDTYEKEANLLNIFFDANGKYDNLSSFLKGRVYFHILACLKNKYNQLSFENIIDKVREGKNYII